jgi:hypothetical protein
MNVGHFSRDVVGTLVGEYMHIARRLTDRRWDLITDLCDKPKGNGGNAGLMMRSGQVNRRALYEPSSPMKGSDIE